MSDRCGEELCPGSLPLCDCLHRPPLTERAATNVIHVYPVGDLIEHDTDSDDCPCVPTIELVESDGPDGWLVSHHSLDGREQRETQR